MDDSIRIHGIANDFLVRAVELSWYSRSLTEPFRLVMSWIPYDNTGSEYEVGRVLNEDGTFNLEQYKAYSPLFLSFVPLVQRPS